MTSSAFYLREPGSRTYTCRAGAILKSQRYTFLPTPVHYAVCTWAIHGRPYLGKVLLQPTAPKASSATASLGPTYGGLHQQQEMNSVLPSQEIQYKDQAKVRSAQSSVAREGRLSLIEVRLNRNAPVFSHGGQDVLINVHMHDALV